MLKNEETWQSREGTAIDLGGIEGYHRHAEEASDGVEELVFVDLTRIENLGDPRPAVQILGELDGLVLRLDASGEKQINYRLANGGTHLGDRGWRFGAEPLSAVIVKSSNIILIIPFLTTRLFPIASSAPKPVRANAMPEVRGKTPAQNQASLYAAAGANRCLVDVQDPGVE